MKALAAVASPGKNHGFTAFRHHPQLVNRTNDFHAQTTVGRAMLVINKLRNQKWVKMDV